MFFQVLYYGIAKRLVILWDLQKDLSCIIVFYPLVTM